MAEDSAKMAESSAKIAQNSQKSGAIVLNETEQDLSALLGGRPPSETMPEPSNDQTRAEQGPATSAPSLISPELAQALSGSSAIKDENLKAQLQGIAAPLMTPNEEAQLAEEKQPQNFTEKLTGVAAPEPIQSVAAIDATPVPALEQVDPSKMSQQERQAYLKEKLSERDARMREKILAGQATPEEKLEFAKNQQKLAEKEVGESAINARDRESQIAGKYDLYLQKLNEVQQNNKLFAAQGLPLEPEPNIMEFMSKEDLQFAVQDPNVDIPEPVAIKAKEELEVYAEAEDLAAKKQVEREAVNKQKAAAQVQAEEVLKSKEAEVKAKADVSKKQQELKTQFTSMSDLFENASDGKKFSVMLGIVVGGIAQGLMGSSTNPAVQMLERTFDDNLEKQKLAFDMYNEKLKLAAKNVTSPLEAQKLQNAILEGQKKSLEIEEKLITKELSKSLGNALTPEQAAAARRTEEKSRLVSGPDGKEYLAKNNDVARKLTEFKNETEPAIEQLNEIVSLVGTYNKMNPLDPGRRDMESRLVAISGKLRIPLTGPGVLTNEEYKRLREAVGDPNRILTLESLELSSLNAVKDVLQTDLKNRYRNAGVNIPTSKEDRAISAIMKNPRIKNKREAVNYARARNWEL